MAKRRHKFVVHSFEELKAAYPLAVKETLLHTHDYNYIARLLDCKLPVPGVEVVGDEPQLDLENLTNGDKNASTSRRS